MALQSSPGLEYVGNTVSLVVQVIQAILAMSSPKSINDVRLKPNAKSLETS